MTAAAAAPRGRRGRRRASAALVGVMVAFAAWPLVESHTSLLNTDWPSYATGGSLVLHHPAALYDRPTQVAVEREIVSGARLTGGEQGDYLSFDQGPWIALLATPFVALGVDPGARLWIELELLCTCAAVALVARTTGNRGALAAAASVPTGLVLANAQLDGLFVLGLGLAAAAWSRSRWVAGAALTLCVAKPQLALPLAAAVLLSRNYRVLAGWVAGVAMLVLLAAAIHAPWLVEWPRFVAHGAGRLGYELGLTGFVLRLDALGGAAPALALVTLGAGLALVLWLARRRTGDPGAVVAVLLAGGFLLSPHVLASDTALLALALLFWGRARAVHWLALSGLALAAAVLHPLAISSAVGIALGLGALALVARQPALGEDAGEGRVGAW